MTEAIAKSEIPPEEIDYINVHGTGTPSNDLSEGLAIRRIFGDKILRSVLSKRLSVIH